MRQDIYSKKYVVTSSIFVILGIIFITIGGILISIAISPVPSISSFSKRQVNQSTKIYDRTGQVLLYDYNRDAKRNLIPLSEMSPNVIQAVVAIEDSSFYKHGGIRLASIIRAAITDIIGGKFKQGGSTITQQVVKNLLLTNKKSIVRKAHEWMLAIKLEEVYSKNQILQTYLNNIPYSGTIYGVETASEAYFGIPAKDLSLSQSAYLAAMIQAPSFYSPYGTHKDDLIARKNIVLNRMYTLGFINKTNYINAKVKKVYFSKKGSSSIIAPHFVFYILKQLKNRYGDKVITSGLKVTTTLDIDLQKKAQEIIKQGALLNVKKFKATNAALIAIAPKTGQILAMVGSRDFFDTKIDGQYNATLALRQPGSTMKPFAYALALMKGYTRDTVVFDVPTQFSTECKPSEINDNKSPCYAPVNFDGKFRGPMTFETALAQSINIPAIKVLYLVGIKNMINLAKSFGLTTLVDANQYGLTIVLGGGDVRLLDLVGAYATFADNGVKNKPVGILEVDDTKSKILYKYTKDRSIVIPKKIAFDISAMLSDAPARVPEYSLNSPLSFPGYDVAVKTGTTNDTRDAWVVGYTPSIAIGVWAGNNDNSPMVQSVAGFISVPMWHKVMAYALFKYPKKYFGAPDPIYSSVPQMLQGNWRIPDKNGNIIPHSLLYWINRNNPRSAPPTNPEKNSQFTYWEYGISSWYNSHPDLFLNKIMLLVPLVTLSTSTKPINNLKTY